MLKDLSAVTPEGTRRLEIEVANPTRMLSRLRQVPGVRDATLFGQTIHALVANDLSDQALQNEIEKSERVVSLRAIAPSLEDVFVTLTKATDFTSKQAAPSQPAQDPSTPSEHVSSEPLSSQGHLHLPAERKLVPRRFNIWRGLRAMATKEFAHLRREPATIFLCWSFPSCRRLSSGMRFVKKSSISPP